MSSKKSEKNKNNNQTKKSTVEGSRKAESPPKAKHNRASRKQKIVKKGRVIKVLPNTLFRVELDDNGEILASLAGKLRMYKIRILRGDRVRVEMSPYDKERGRIVYRLK